MATHFSILAWKIPRTEELGGLQLQRIVHDYTHTYTHLLVICKTKLLYLYLIIESYILHSFLPCLHPRKLTIVVSITLIVLLCDWFQLMGSTSRRLDGRRREWSEYLPPFPILLPALLCFCQWPVTVTASVKCWNSLSQIKTSLGFTNMFPSPGSLNSRNFNGFLPHNFIHTQKSYWTLLSFEPVTSHMLILLF